MAQRLFQSETDGPDAMALSHPSQRHDLANPLGSEASILRFIINQPTPLVTINHVLTSDRAYLSCQHSVTTLSLRAFRRIRAIARLIGGGCEIGGLCCNGGER